MKTFVVVGALVASSLAQQTAQFANTTFNNTYTVGQTLHLMWTTGNGLPISLSIANSTWNYKVFSGRAVLPTSYDWTVTAVPGFVSGNYQLALEQANGGVSNSPVIGIVVPGSTNGTNATNATASAVVATTTVTYISFDPACGCTKTGTATVPASTALPVTTTRWWDEGCGCHKSTVVPVLVTAVPTANNYTVPAAPPVTTAPAPAPPTATKSAPGATFTGEAVRLGNSMLGSMIAMLVISALF